MRQGDDWLADYLPYLLFRVSNRLDLKLREALRKLKISIWLWRVLAVLRAYGTMTIGQIAHATAIEQPTVSRVVAQLASKGWVERETRRHDSRYVHVTLTREGGKALAEILPAALRHETRALEGISAQDKAKLKQLLETVWANIEG